MWGAEGSDTEMGLEEALGLSGGPSCSLDAMWLWVGSLALSGPLSIPSLQWTHFQ